MRGTPGNAKFPASRSQVMKPKPQELPACLAAGGWWEFHFRAVMLRCALSGWAHSCCDAALHAAGVGSRTL
jgi:hypothetical protein